jgi:hypothetical protein
MWLTKKRNGCNFHKNFVLFFWLTLIFGFTGFLFLFLLDNLFVGWLWFNQMDAYLSL